MGLANRIGALTIAGHRDGGVTPIPIPSPDAIFDSRTGLNIQDSVGGEIVTVGGFPMVYMDTTTGFYPRYTLNCTPSLVEQISTCIILMKRRADFLSTKSKGASVNMFNDGLLTTTTYSTITYTAPSYSFLRANASLNINEWMLIGSMFDNPDGNKRYNIFDLINIPTQVLTNPVTTYGSVSLGMWGDNSQNEFYHRGVFVFNRLLTQNELNNIRLNGIYPSDGSMIICLPALNPDINTQIEGVHRYSGAWLDNGVNLKPPLTPWVDRDDLATGAYNLFYGYTRQGLYVIPYMSTSTKGAHSHVDDIEYPASSCIHNMAESRINFSGITDATIKAIFDKSNRTYWKASIEATAHYIDAGGGYYGLWHPSELLTTFIDTHAQAGHNGHILASVRTSGAVVNGITAIRVYKTSL